MRFSIRDTGNSESRGRMGESEEEITFSIDPYLTEQNTGMIDYNYIRIPSFEK